MTVLRSCGSLGAMRRTLVLLLTLATVAPAGAAGAAGAAGEAGAGAAAGAPWWVWTLALFVLSFALGTVAVLAGVGGGVLFVPIVGSFFPFHIDFVRGAGLMIALAGAMSASPGLLRRGLADMNVGLVMALAGSAASIAGAMVGLAVPAHVIETSLGIAILVITGLMLLARRSDFPSVVAADPLAKALHLGGVYHEPSLGRDIAWKAHHTPTVMALFLAIGFMGGMFGLGAGWANVPALNLVLGAPLKVAVSTSSLLLSLNGPAAAWVYLHRGAVLPLIAVPSVAGMMLGTAVGVRLLARADTAVVRRVVIVFLLLAGLRSLLKGVGLWT